MKNKSGSLWIGLVLTLGFLSPGIADQTQGFVESIDTSNNSLQIKDPVSGEAKIVQVHPKVISQVKKGSVVKATLKSGSSQADTLEVLVAE